MYSEMYSPKRNRFVPEKEVPKTLDILPPIPQTDAGLLPPNLPPPAVAPPTDGATTPPSPEAPAPPALPPL
jgi:hypothetical protein